MYCNEYFCCFGDACVELAPLVFAVVVGVVAIISFIIIRVITSRSARRENDPSPLPTSRSYLDERDGDAKEDQEEASTRTPRIGEVFKYPNEDRLEFVVSGVDKDEGEVYGDVYVYFPAGSTEVIRIDPGMEESEVIVIEYKEGGVRYAERLNFRYDPKGLDDWTVYWEKLIEKKR